MYRVNAVKFHSSLNLYSFNVQRRLYNKNFRVNLKANKVDLDALVKNLQNNPEVGTHETLPHGQAQAQNIWTLKSTEKEQVCEEEIEYEEDSLGVVIDEMPKEMAEDFEKTRTSLGINDKVVKINKIQNMIKSIENPEFIDYEGLKEFIKDHKVTIGDLFKIEEKDGNLNESLGPMNPKGYPSKKFRDCARICLQAGNGGNGAISFFKDNRTRKGVPDGGNGGKGGDIIIMASKGCKPNLGFLMPVYRASNGGNGMKSKKNGKDASSLVIEVPVGTTITEYRKSKLSDDSHRKVKGKKVTKESTMSSPSESSDSRYDLNSDGLSNVVNLEEIEGLSFDQIDRCYKEILKFYPESTITSSKGDEYYDCDDIHVDGSKMDRLNSKTKERVNNSTNMRIPDNGYLNEKGCYAEFNGERGDETRHLIDLDDILSPHGAAKFKIEAKLSEHHKYYSNVLMGSEKALEVDGFGSKEQMYSNLNNPRNVDLDEDGSYFVAARGGVGGLGNWKLNYLKKSNFSKSTTQGKAGESLMYKLELKIIADVGLVGFPNAGKSTFLSRLSRATPKIASYPFTTLSPHIGVVQFEDYSQYSIADLPGLVEGAHYNRGLGHEFLRHIERTKIICYVLDMAAIDGNDPYDTLSTLFEELELYKGGIVDRPSLIVANKMDLENSSSNLENFMSKMRGSKFEFMRVYPVSALGNRNLEAVVLYMRNLLGIEGEVGPSRIHKRHINSGWVTIDMASK